VGPGPGPYREMLLSCPRGPRCTTARTRNWCFLRSGARGTGPAEVRPLEREAHDSPRRITASIKTPTSLARSPSARLRAPFYYNEAESKRRRGYAERKSTHCNVRRASCRFDRESLIRERAARMRARMHKSSSNLCSHASLASADASDSLIETILDVP